LNGTLFKIYIVVFNVSLHKDNGISKLLIMLLIMFISVRFLLLATTFCYSVPGIIDCAITPSSSRNFTNRLDIYNVSVYLP
jgi:hypothetical protein